MAARARFKVEVEDRVGRKGEGAIFENDNHPFDNNMLIASHQPEEHD